MVERLFLAVLWGCLQFVIVVIPDHTHLLFSTLPSPLSKMFQRKTENIFLPIIFNICLGYSEEPSH